MHGLQKTWLATLHLTDFISDLLCDVMTHTWFLSKKKSWLMPVFIGLNASSS